MEIVALNAGYLMVLAGISPSLEQGYNDARQVIRNGLALKKINDIRAENEEEKDPGWES
jgi:anthranilate phosphoribosyltransferase